MTRAPPQEIRPMIDAQPTIVSLTDAATSRLAELTKDEDLSKFIL